MNCWPIVERELRVAARRPSTYWLRSLTALVVLVVWSCLMLGQQVAAFRTGQDLFNALGVLGLGLCLLSGLVLTADCLSQEKRAGTLGLLFLTSLRGVDVVLGKLVATSVHALYGVLVITPVLGISMFFGGVTFGELGRVVLVLVAALLLSLATGMFLSALCREPTHGLLGTFLWLFIQAGALPCVGWLTELVSRHPVSRYWLLPSPAYTYWMAFDSAYRLPSGPLDFWTSIATMLSVCGALFAVACWVTPRAWQEREGTRTGGFGFRQRSASAKGRYAAILGRWLDQNPFQWLCAREVLSRRRGWIVIKVLLAGWFGSGVCMVLLPRDPPGFFMVCLVLSFGLHLVFKALVAAEAFRRFSEDRQSGNWELLLVTPLPRTALLKGYRAAMRACLFGRLGLLIAVNLVLLLAIHLFPKAADLANDATGMAIFSRLFLGGAGVLLFDYWALIWVGMRVGLRVNSFQRGVFATLAQVMLVPWLAFFLLVFLANNNGMSDSAFRTALTWWFVLGALNDLWVGARARQLIHRTLGMPPSVLPKRRQGLF